MSFSDNSELIDCLLRWWSTDADLSSDKDCSRLYDLRKYEKGCVWRYCNKELIQDSPDFLLTMSRVLCKRGSKRLDACLKDLWDTFPDIDFAKCVEDEDVKRHIKENHKPRVIVERKGSDVLIKNCSLYSINDVSLIITVFYTDDTPQNCLRLSHDCIKLRDFYSKSEFIPKSTKWLFINNIERWKIESFNCNEQELLGVEIRPEKRDLN